MNEPTDVGLLVMHYGTPASQEDILPYYTHIRGGRMPSAELLDDLVARYEAIGGPSPLESMSRAQAHEIGAALLKRGVAAKVYVGAKHASPFVGDALKQMAADGIERAMALVLAPHYSTYSVAAYKKAAQEARDTLSPNMKIGFLERWGTLPALIDGLAQRVEAQLSGLNRDETIVIFTAHSLPERIIAQGDPYKSELMETAELVAKKLALRHWIFAFQSASSTGEPWLGPDVLDAIEREASRYRNVVCCTVGFVCDHLEVLYDLGIEARGRCAELGLEFRLAATIGADPAVMDALAETALHCLPGATKVRSSRAT